ncbi:MAG: flagellar protein FlgN [Gammaproteobacteria bacterium]|nr:flagellar protein FlgN [Gammaproteobacteria bacterium]
MQTDILNIHEEIAEHTDHLLTCLYKELDTLNAHDYKELVSIACEKQTLVKILDDLEKKRQSLVADRNYTDYLNQIDKSETLANQWNSIVEKIKQCHHQNEINGRLINRFNQITRETLDIFTGNTNNADITYSPESLKKGINARITNTRA